MSQQGERRGTQHDWWRELYEEGSDDAGPAPGGDSLDDRVASAFRAAGAPPPGPGPSARSGGPPPPGPPGPGAPSAPGAGPGGDAGAPQDGPPDARAPQDGPPEAGASRGGPPDSGPPRTHDDGPGPAARPPRRDVPPPRDGRAGGADDGPAAGAPAPAGAVGAAGAAGARTSRVSDPARVGYVGDRPPTYEPEPTALPLADPAGLRTLVPDTVLDGARYGPLTLRAASLRGDSARFRGEPRRDALLTARFGAGESALLLVAVATGLRAAEGAHRAAHEVCEWIGGAVGRSQARLAADLRAGSRAALRSGLHRLTARSLGRLRTRAAELGLDPDTYTASLRCLLLPADPACRTRVFFGAGAGGLFRLRDGAWQDLEPPVREPREPGEPRGTWEPKTPGTADRAEPDAAAAATSGGPAAGAADGRPADPDGAGHPAGGPAGDGPPDLDPFRFRASVARPGDTLLLCSPGLAEPLRGEPALARALGERWAGAEPPGLAGFLADAQTRVKGYADDRTAAAVWEA